MDVQNLIRLIGAEFYTGVPDSLLRALCDFLMETYGTNPMHHIIGANEGNCTAIAAGYYLATGKVPVVYLQNSGEGNIVNPAVSLLNDHVYGIPVLFLVGWRGEPGIHDEPQHIYQGQITLKLLEDMDMGTFVIGTETDTEEIQTAMTRFRTLFSQGKSAAFVVRRGALTHDKKAVYSNGYVMLREEIIRHIVQISGNDPIISTTGKTSRELFEVREAEYQEHRYDFLTVGSMGYASSIALGVALRQPNRKVWCIDGDGAALMHMGAIAVIGAGAPGNLVHVVINNEAYESVGGMPTAASKIDLVGIAKACGYPYAVCVDSFEKLDAELQLAKEQRGLCLIEVKCAIGARADLGRPAIAAKKNKEDFMRHLAN